MTRRSVLIVCAILGIASPAFAQSPPLGDAGYIGRKLERLEIDDCRPNDPSLTQAQLVARAGEHFSRGTTLYIQGDYEGAVQELVAAYCAAPLYNVLKDIGQAYERSLEYEKAIAYLERYVAAVPPDAKRASQCAPDPQDDKGNVGRRIRVLENLPSRVYVQTTPSGAQVVIGNDSGVKARASSGEQIAIVGGEYEMTIELAGYETVTQKIDVRIGKPYTYYAKLEPLRGRLSVQVTPPDARVFVGDRFVGIGRYEEQVPGGAYTISVESEGHQRVERKVEVIPGQLQRELVELEPLPQTGRRQLLVATAVGGGIATGALLFAFQENAITGVGSIIGGAAGLVGGYFQFPRDLSLGTSNLTITSAVTGGIGGFVAARVFTDKSEIIQPLVGAGILVGGAAGYYMGERFEVTPGEAAVFNSTLLWGTTAGVLFSQSFDAPRSTSAGLTLSGLGMGGIGGILLARTFDVSRTHAVLIDIGGLVGIIGGLATKSLAYPSTTDADSVARSDERLANFALGGMALGLVAAGILTRNLDEPDLSLKPSLGTATGGDGKTATTFGVSGSW